MVVCFLAYLHAVLIPEEEGQLWSYHLWNGANAPGAVEWEEGGDEMTLPLERQADLALPPSLGIVWRKSLAWGGGRAERHMGVEKPWKGQTFLDLPLKKAEGIRLHL